MTGTERLPEKANRFKLEKGGRFFWEKKGGARTQGEGVSRKEKKNLIIVALEKKKETDKRGKGKDIDAPDLFKKGEP